MTAQTNLMTRSGLFIQFMKPDIRKQHHCLTNWSIPSITAGLYYLGEGNAWNWLSISFEKNGLVLLFFFLKQVALIVMVHTDNHLCPLKNR